MSSERDPNPRLQMGQGLKLGGRFCLDEGEGAAAGIKGGGGSASSGSSVVPDDGAGWSEAMRLWVAWWCYLIAQFVSRNIIGEKESISL